MEIKLLRVTVAFLGCLLAFISVKGQDMSLGKDKITVKGIVKDETGPMIGVSIKLKANLGIGTVSNADGFYSIVVPANGTLIFSYVGFKDKEIDVKGESTVNVQLESDNGLDEVSVVAYGVQKKESLVGAISTVKVRDLKTPTRSLTNALAGRVAGVIAVQRSGEPGNDDAQFWIRGVSTFGAGSSPLVLVDGIERALGNIEPEEIESFSVLKDASATAVYGIRGANGVILVNTRKGQNGKPVVSLKTESGLIAATSLPKLADAATVFELYNEANLNVNPNFKTPYTPDIIETYRLQSDPILYPDIDWIDLMMKDRTNNKRTNLNVSGGGDVAKYFVSGTYYSEDGIWKGDDLKSYNSNTTLKRYNFRANTDIKLNQYTELSLGLGGILFTRNFSGMTSDHLWSWILKSAPGDYYPTYPNPEGDGIVYGGSGSHAVRSPYSDLVNTGYQTTWNSNIQSAITLKHDFSWVMKGLSLSGMFSFDAENYHNIQRTREGDLYRATARDQNGDLILNKYYDGQEDLNFGKQSGGNRRMYLQTNINYDRTFNDHTIGGLLLYNQQDFVNANAGNSISALPYRLQGLVGKVTYGYKYRYFAELNAGYNGSENFKKGHRFGFFPSVAVGWVASSEPFFNENIKFLEYLKFRFSYGQKGNDQIGGRRFAYLTTIGGGNGGWRFGPEGTNGYGGKGEDEWGADLTWELENEVNVGFETRFLKGFSLQADIFKRHRSGIFMQRSSLPEIMGLNKNPWGNIGEMENKGIDATLAYRKMIGKLDVSLRGNFTFARNKIIENDQPELLYPYQSGRGKRLGQPFGLKSLGLYTAQDFDDINQGILKEHLPVPMFGGRVKPGDIKYLDYNEDGLVNSYDMVAIGNPYNPELVYGFGASVAYKGFDISVFFQGLSNMDFMLGGDGFLPFREPLAGLVAQQIATDRWTEANPRQDALFPRLAIGDNVNNYIASDWWQRDASYLRLKTVEMGYTFPKRLTSKIKMDNLRFYMVGMNLFTWSKFKYWDPELGSGNGGKYPIQKNFSFGLNVNF